MKKNIAAFLYRLASKLDPEGNPIRHSKYGEIKRVCAAHKESFRAFAMARPEVVAYIKEDVKKTIAGEIACALLSEGYISFTEIESQDLDLCELRGEVNVVAKFLQPS